MIQLILPTNPAHPNHKKIMDLYWYMVARVLPFCLEDIFPKNKFFLQDREWDIKDFYASYPVDNKNEMQVSKEVQKKRKNAREKKAKNVKGYLKKNVDFLYDFLYENDGYHVNTENLRLLLCGEVNEDAWCRWKSKYAFKEIDSPIVRKELKKIFNYDSFSTISFGDKKLIHYLITLMDMEVCPYCNRNYITIYQGGRQSEMDHYLPQSKYPYFSVSLLNLIPCCKPCNHVKGEGVVGLYPYSEGFGKKVNFVTRPQKGVGYLIGIEGEEDEYYIDIRYEGDDKEFERRLMNSRKAFHLDEVYQSHRRYVTGMFRQRYYFGKEYLESIQKSFPELKLHPEEILYNHRLDEQFWGQESLSKLTHDINEEINRLI